MARGERIPFVGGRKLATVPVTLNTAREFTLLADTGAERMVISRQTAVDLGLDLAHPLRLEPLAGVGRTPPVPVVRLSHVRVGAITVTGLEASVLDLPAILRADGLLGSSFLSRFRVTFEYDTKTLVLREPPKP